MKVKALIRAYKYICVNTIYFLSFVLFKFISTFIPLLYNFNLCCTDVIAPNTDNLLTRLLIFEAVPNSSANIFETRGIWSFGGMMREIMLVPLLK